MLWNFWLKRLKKNLSQFKAFRTLLVYFTYLHQPHYRFPFYSHAIFAQQEIVGDVKDVTVCSGYGSTGDNAQENTDKSEDSGVNNGDLNSDSWIADDSFGNTAITESRDVGSTEDEGHEVR